MTHASEALPELGTFDLTKVGLGGTLCVGVFLIIGHVAKTIAGPAVILSVIIAAIIAFLAGTFYAELNCTIVMPLWRSVKLKTLSPSIASTATIQSISAIISPPSCATINHTNAPAALSSKLLLPSFIFTYFCMGEFAAFVVGWNLLLEQVIGVAVVAKGIASYVDTLIFDSARVNITQIQPISSNISDYFDFFAFFIPILVGGPLVLILRRSTVLSTMSVILSLAVVVFILILGIINADVNNWTASPAINSTVQVGNGGFFPFGISGMFQGAALLLFTFIGFDSMVYYPLNWYSSEAHQIVDFQKTLTTSILSINGILFISLIGATVALTSIWPYYQLKEVLPLPNAFANIGWSGTIFIVLIAGIIALFGSLFAFMHAILRTIQAMAFDGPRAFKLFAKFQQNNLLREIQLQQAKQQQQQQQQQQTSSTPQRHSDVQPQYHNHRQQQLPILGFLIFALLAGLLAALFALEHLMNLLSIGALLMFYTLTLDIILLRYSPNSKKIFSQPDSVAAESGTHAAADMPKRAISLIAILLTIYCILCKILVVLIKLVEYDVIRLPIEWSVSILVVFIIAMVSILFVMGLQPKRNSMFELKLSVNPLFPAANIFACVYLMSELHIVTWIRYIIWMLIGIALYIIVLKVNHQRRQQHANSNVFLSDHNHTNTTMTEMEEITGSVETVKSMEDDASDSNCRSMTPPDVIPKIIESDEQTIESIECPMVNMPEMHAEAVNSSYGFEQLVSSSANKPMETQYNGIDDIEFADDVKMCSIEKCEPNGKVYFVEMDLTASPSSLKTIYRENIANSTNSLSFGENGIIQEMVDKVIYQSDRTQSRQEISEVNDEAEHNDESDADDAEIETRAIVHTINDDVLELTIKENPIPIEAEEMAKPFFTIGNYESSHTQIEHRTELIGPRSEIRPEFKDRLTKLLGQYSEEPIKLQISLPPKRSISTSDNINTTIMTNGRNNIPVAPKFDQLMYNTIGRRTQLQHNKIQVPAMSIENEFAKSLDRFASNQIHRTKNSDDLLKIVKYETESDATTADVSSIREKLNAIYGRGRPPVAAFVEENANSESVNDRRNSEDGIQMRKPIKLYDAIHKQLFSDVLKLINPDVRNSLHRTESVALADVQAATHKD